VRTVRGTALAVAAKSVWANSAQQGRRGQFRPVFIVLIINTDDVPGEVIGTTIGELQMQPATLSRLGNRSATTPRYSAHRAGPLTRRLYVYSPSRLSLARSYGLLARCQNRAAFHKKCEDLYHSRADVFADRSPRINARP
jgi:hypothetical protein